MNSQGCSSVLWVNETARFLGGCEQYVYNTVSLLAARGVRSTLLYDERQGEVSTDFLRAFDGAFPMVDVARQVQEIAPNVVYIHRLNDANFQAALTWISPPTLRFFHDYRHFCLRENKYKTLTNCVCNSPIGWRCYPCLGFVRRQRARRGFSFSSLRSAQAVLQVNRAFSAWAVGSKYMAGEVAAHDFDRKRIHVIPLYAQVPASSENIVVRERDSLLFVGQLIRSKGLDILLKALALTSRPVRLTIAGHGPQEGLFRKQCTQLGIDGRVTFLGQVSHRNLSEFYRFVTCVVMPSRYPETFGLIGPEAMSYGTPVIGTSVGAIGEWLEHGVTGLAVPPNDARVLARAIDEVTGNPELARRMGEQGKRRYEALFRPERHIDALIRLFERLEAGKAEVIEPHVDELEKPGSVMTGASALSEVQPQ